MLIHPSAPRKATPQRLVDLLGECHERIRRFTALARRAATQVDAPPDQVVQACLDVERYFGRALPLHVADEEESFEPRLRGASAEIDQALETLARQHQAHTAKVERLLRASADVRNDPGDLEARDALAAIAGELEADFAEHLALEERVVFPAIDQHLTHEIQAGILAEMRARRDLGGPSLPPELRP